MAGHNVHPIGIAAALHLRHHVTDIHRERDTVGDGLDVTVQVHIHVSVRRLCEIFHLIIDPVAGRADAATRIRLVRQRMSRAKFCELSDDILDSL